MEPRLYTQWLTGGPCRRTDIS